MTAALQPLRFEANLPALSLAVVRRGEVICQYAAGASVSPETPFQVCCLGKPVTLLALLLLQEEGRLCLDDPAARYLPASCLPRPSGAAAAVTIRQLLSHRAGIIRGSFRADVRSFEDYASESHGSEFVYPPGSRYKFSNLAYFLSGAILERVANRSVSEFLAERIFRSLGMASATFERPALAPPGHSRGEYYALVHTGDNLQPAPAFPLPAASGGFYCSAPDYARFVAAMVGSGSAPGPVTARVRTEFRQIVADGADPFRHTGSNSGYSALAVGDAAQEIGAVAFCNRANASHELLRALEIASGTVWDALAVPSSCFAGEFSGASDLLRLRPGGRALLADFGPHRFGLRRRGAKSFLCENGPLREYVLRFSLRDGRARSCSAGPWYFSGDAARDNPRGQLPDLAGKYSYPCYATAEIFVRRNRLYCLCGPLHEARLVPLAPDLYIQHGGLFDGETLHVRRRATGLVSGIEMGGMPFARLEEI